MMKFLMHRLFIYNSRNLRHYLNRSVFEFMFHIIKIKKKCVCYRLSFRDSTLKEHLEKDRAAKRIDSLFCILPNHGDFLSEIDGLIGNVEDFIESFIISESE